MVAKIKVTYDDSNATESLEDLAEGAGYTGSEFDKMSDRVEEAEQSTKKMGKTADQAATIFGKLGGVLAAAFSLEKIVEATNRTNRMADALVGAQINTGLAKMETEELARELQVASSNALSYADALEFISRGTQTMVLSTEDMADAIRFATVNAKATGQDARQAIEQVTEALVNSSAETLKKIGLLPGGIDQVRFAYDELHGSVGLFDQLSEEARRLEVQLVSLEIMRDRIQDFDDLGLSGMNTMDELSGAWGRLKNALSAGTEQSGAGEWFGRLATTIDRAVIPAIEGATAAITEFWRRWELMQSFVINVSADLVTPLEKIGFVAEGTADEMRDLSMAFLDARDSERAFAEQQANSRDDVAARIKAEREAAAAERKAAAERWQTERDAAQQAAEAARQAEQAERDRERQLREMQRAMEQRARDIQRAEQEAERERERAYQEQIRLEKEQHRERMRQLEEQKKKEEELAAIHRERIDTIKNALRGGGGVAEARGGDGASLDGGGGGRAPQGMQFGGPLAGIFGGLFAEQAGRFARAGGMPRPPQGVAGFASGMGGGGGFAGAPGGVGVGDTTQQVIDKVLGGINERQIQEAVVAARVKAAEEERDAIIAAAQRGEGGTIQQRRQNIRQARADFREQNRDIRMDVFAREDFSHEERTQAVADIIQQDVERAGKRAKVDQNAIQAMTELAQEQAAQIQQLDRLEKQQQALISALGVNRRTRAQRAGRGR